MIVKKKSKIILVKTSTTAAIEERSLRGSRGYGGVHTSVITTEKNCLNQWQVVSCSFKLDGVTGILAKSQAAIREALERLEGESEGEIDLPTVQVDYLSKIVNKFVLS